MLKITEYNNNINSYYAKYSKREDSVNVAEELARKFRGVHNVKHIGVITFCATGNTLEKGLQIYDIKGKKHNYASYTVLCINDKVADPIHGFKLMSMSDYIARLVMSALPFSGICVARGQYSNEWGMYLVSESVKEHTDCDCIFDKGVGFNTIPSALWRDKRKLSSLLSYYAKFDDRDKQRQAKKLVIPIGYCEQCDSSSKNLRLRFNDILK